jgi:Ca-activated chloride channel family protein
MDRVEPEARMSVQVASPLVLAALLFVPLFVLFARGARLAGALRAGAATATILALAGVAIERDRPARGACLVAVVDVSASVGDAAVARARAALAALLPALDTNDLVGSVAFAAHSRVVAAPGPAHALATLLPAALPDDDEAAETDVAAAVATASALCPSGRQPALLLFSDGNETTGDVLAETAYADPPVPVFPDPPAVALPNLVLRRLVAPALAPSGTVVPVAAVIEARTRTSAAVSLEVDGQSELPRPRALVPGVNVVTIPYRPGAPGDRRLEARVLVAPDEAPATGRAGAALTVTERVRVLVVSERATPSVVAAALAHQGMEPEVVSPATFAARSRRLGDWHAVVLDDVGRAALPTAALDALARWVADGGALVVTGGEHLFGDPGFVESPLARVLPVALVSQTPEPSEREPIGLFLVIDRSNSMAELGPHGTAKIEYARRAALAVLEQLEPRDLVGAIVFDSEAYELGVLAPVASARAPLTESIRSLRPGGGTNFLDALARAGSALAAAGPAVRHVILLTDGDTNAHASDHDPVLHALAEDDVSVTTIRIGTDTVNLDLLYAIARRTGGEFHHVTDMETLPQLMIRDTQQRMDASAGRRDARARIVDPGSLLAGLAESDLPPVARWALTRARPGAQVHLEVHAGSRRDPLLVTWQHELGRVAVIPLDFQASAAGWAAWPGFASFVGRVALWAAPRGLAGDRSIALRRTRAGTELRVDTVGDPPAPPVVAFAGRDVPLRQRGRRRFETVLPAATTHAELRDARGALTPLDLATPSGPSGRETRAVGIATARLEALARATGGAMSPTPAMVLAARHGTTRESVPLDGALVPLALAGLLADVALRRPGRG